MSHEAKHINQSDKIIQAVRQWLESVVIGLNLCPFARRELEQESIRFALTDSVSEEALLHVLITELELLNNDESIETTLIIHPQTLQDFDAYNQFLQLADELLVDLDLDGIYQIASFHPHYQFDGTTADAAENYSNRSPYPLLHLLRETSVERAVASHADIDSIPQRNIEHLNQLGKQKLQALLQACRPELER
jgi:hypothetical protein